MMTRAPSNDKAPSPELAHRLDAVATLVPAGANGIVDIGYDHGNLLAALARRGELGALIGVERQAVSAPRCADRHGLGFMKRMDLRVGDGLAPLKRGDAEVAVMAGLGERTMLAVLDASPEVLEGIQRVVCCPSHIEAELRPGLAARGWHVVAEALAFERGRFYLALAAERRPRETENGDFAFRWGPCLFESKDPNLSAYLAHTRAAFSAAFRAGLRGYEVADEAGEMVHTRLGEKLALLGAAEAEVSRW